MNTKGQAHILEATLALWLALLKGPQQLPTLNGNISLVVELGSDKRAGHRLVLWQGPVGLLGHAQSPAVLGDTESLGQPPPL